MWGLSLKENRRSKINNFNFNIESIIGGKTGILKGNNNEYIIESKGPPECSKACPAGINVKAYVNLIANKKFEEAIDVVRISNPFPGVCGRVCTRPCESFCEQKEKGSSISIRALKRFASDFESARRPLYIEPCKINYDEKVAIIGAGPAGLTAAVDLVRIGYSVTVFESEKNPGGMLYYGIPSYRLPKHILKRDIKWIKGLGVKIKINTRIDNPLKLFDEGYSVILISQGCWKSLPLNIEGEDANGIIDALFFLRVLKNQNQQEHYIPDYPQALSV